MALPKSLTQPFRKGSLLVGGGWRAFMQPYNAALGNTTDNTSAGVAILDLQVLGPFNESAPPLHFFDLGWITQFKMTPASKIGMVRSGYRGAVRAMYRGEVGETIEMTFRESTRMAWKVATGSEVFNLLKNPAATASTVGPLSSSGVLAVPIAASGGYSATGYASTPSAGFPTLLVPAGSGGLFPAGSYIVCDRDLIPGEYGYIGDAGINVFKDAVTDVDFIRKTSDYTSRVNCVYPNMVAGYDGLTLGTRFVGGGNQALPSCSTGTVDPPYSPGNSAKVQLIKGFAVREGGSFITEWSGLICMDTIDGSQVALYYPHLAPNQFREMGAWAIENAGTTDLTGYELSAVMQALAYDDPLDGETVVRYAAYYPAPNLNFSF